MTILGAPQEVFSGGQIVMRRENSGMRISAKIRLRIKRQLKKKDETAGP